MLLGIGVHLDFGLSNHRLTNNGYVLLIIDLIISEPFFEKPLECVYYENDIF